MFCLVRDPAFPLPARLSGTTLLSHDPTGTLPAGVKHYWRIDVTDEDTSTTYTGYVKEFTIFKTAEVVHEWKLEDKVGTPASRQQAIPASSITATSYTQYSATTAPSKSILAE